MTELMKVQSGAFSTNTRREPWGAVRGFYGREA